MPSAKVHERVTPMLIGYGFHNTFFGIGACKFQQTRLAFRFREVPQPVWAKPAALNLNLVMFPGFLGAIESWPNCTRVQYLHVE